MLEVTSGIDGLTRRQPPLRTPADPYIYIYIDPSVAPMLDSWMAIKASILQEQKHKRTGKNCLQPKYEGSARMFSPVISFAIISTHSHSGSPQLIGHIIIFNRPSRMHTLSAPLHNACPEKALSMAVY